MGKKITIYDVARQLNISTATVNRALNNKPEVSAQTRELVIETAREMGFVANRTAKNLARGSIRLDFLIYNRLPVFHDEITRGVEQAFRELMDLNVAGSVQTFTGPEQEVRPQMLEKMQMLGQEGHKGLLLLPTADMHGFPDAVSRLSAAGTQTAFINSSLPGSKCVFSLRKNATLAGRMAAELLSWFAPGGKVAIFTGSREVIDHVESIGGFLDESSRRAMNVAGIYENHDDPELASRNTERLLREHPDTAGIYINTANSAAICQKLIEMGRDKQIKVVASDLFPELIRLMQNGIVQATIFQDPFRQGLLAMKQLYRCVAETEAAVGDIFINPQIVLKSNLNTV